MKILVTGAAGFIGFHVAKRLSEKKYDIVGLDNINDYYDTRLKFSRLHESGISESDIEYGKETLSFKSGNYRFVKMNLEDKEGMHRLFRKEKFDKVCHLGAQAGVRYSLENPHAYVDSNIRGFLNILENCRSEGTEHLLYASSSSVYGLNEEQPFSTSQKTDRPISLYAATKKSNELMAHVYSGLFNIPTTGLRFFTVYGPWGRPDMALFSFTKLILEGKPINIYNGGEMERDFTYIDDITEGIIRIMELPVQSNEKDDSPSVAYQKPPYRLYNIGNSKPVRLLAFIELIEKYLGKKAIRNFMPLQAGDVVKTYADVSDLERDTGYKPSTDLELGIKRFVEWYKSFYNVS